MQRNSSVGFAVAVGIIVVSVVLITSHGKIEKESEIEIHESQTPTGSHKPLSASA